MLLPILSTKPGYIFWPQTFFVVTLSRSYQKNDLSYSDDCMSVCFRIVFVDKIDITFCLDHNRLLLLIKTIRILMICLEHHQGCFDAG